MRRSLVKLAGIIAILTLSTLLFGCSAPKPTPDPNLTWSVNLLKYEVKDKLEITDTVTQYIGSTQELHQQYPDAGDVYLIMDLSVSKQNAESTSFDWSQLTVQDSAGKTYPRMSNDTFLEPFKYTPRMTGLVMIMGVNQGWVCYEIPAQAANGKLTLSYYGEGSQQEIVVKK